MILTQFQNIGRNLFTSGLVSSQSGNLSIRMGDAITITRRGCRLGEILQNDLIETKVNKNERCTPLASIELPVHRMIYKLTPALSVVHAHPPHSIALSLVQNEIVPCNSESITLLGTVPVVGIGMDIKVGGLGKIIAEALLEHNIVMVRGHGSFATGQLLEDAYHRTTLLEESARILCLLKSFK